MPTTAFALLVLSGAALYFMNADERARLAQSLVVALRRAIRAATHSSPAGEPFDEFLCARTGWPIVTPVLVTVNALVFTLMLVDRSGSDGTQALIGWGGNYAPRTTNGEWWRLLTAAFVTEERSTSSPRLRDSLRWGSSWSARWDGSPLRRCISPQRSARAWSACGRHPRRASTSARP